MRINVVNKKKRFRKLLKEMNQHKIFFLIIMRQLYWNCFTYQIIFKENQDKKKMLNELRIENKKLVKGDQNFFEKNKFNFLKKEPLF